MKHRNNLSGALMYKSFIPESIEEFNFIVDQTRLQELSDLYNKLSDKISVLSDDDRLQLLKMEANDSWRLADDRWENPFSFTSNFDNQNVDNIVKATVYAAEAVDELPISTRLIRNIHYLICAGTDYDKKYRGEYRISPVWIGKPENWLSGAVFVPPVFEDMISAISDLENYINYSEENVFVKAAIIHYQFEMIHPFIDGNGRTGRLLNNLFLNENGVIPFPVLLLSHIIARDYNKYCSEIQYVNETGDISTWISYWLETLIESGSYTTMIR